MPEFLVLKSPEEARAILAGFDPVGTETVDVAEAAGRVLCEPVAAAHDLPPWPRAVMDGYAVRARDTHGASDAAPAYLRLVGQVAMGGVFAGRVGPGEAVAISTGGVVPESADAVVMIEFADEVRPGEIEARRGVAAGEHVIRPGEDLRAGQTLLARGRRLRPQDAGALAAFGVARVPVYRRPRVAVLSTGNEVVPPEAEPAPGQVRDVNQAVVCGQVRAAGGDPIAAGIARDDASELRARIVACLERADAVMLSGGSSVGVRDLAAGVVASLGPPGVLLHGINVRPGRPTLVASAGGKPIVGLPGFPVSSMVIFDVFMRPLVWRLGGEAPGREPWPARRRARMARRVASPPGREDWLRVRLVERDGAPFADPLPGGSSSLSTVVLADGLVRLDPGCEGVVEGEQVEVLLYAGLGYGT